MARIAGAWAILSPLLLFLPRYDAADGDPTGVSASAADRTAEALAILLPVAALGIAAILAERLLSRGLPAGRILLTAIPFALILLTVLTAANVGPFLLPPAVLLIFPALWLQTSPGVRP